MKRYERNVKALIAGLVTVCCFCFAATSAQTSGANPKPSPNALSSQRGCEAGATVVASGSSQSDLQLSVSELNFGPHDVGTRTNPCVVAVTNAGKDAISGIGAVVGGNYVVASQCEDSLQPAGQCSISVGFAPAAAGELPATLRVSFKRKDESAGAVELQLKGTGYVPRLAASPDTLDFGQQLVNSASAVKTVMLKAGTAAVKVPAISASGDFTVTPAKCDNLDPFATCALAVTFSPKHVSPAQGAITITTDGAPVIVSLSGAGTATCGPATRCFARENWESIAPVLLIVAIYVVALTLVRWNMVAVPTRKFLAAQIASVRARLAGLDKKGPLVQPISTLLNDADTAISKPGGLDYLFWARGQELDGWSRVHEAQQEMVGLLDLESVRAGLKSAQADLRVLNKPEATAMADNIGAALQNPPADPRMAVLREVLDFLAPQGAALAATIGVALPTLTTDQAQQLATSVVAFLQPATAGLADSVQRALNVNPPATANGIERLLQQAATTINPQATGLVAQLQAMLAAPAPPPVPPPAPPATPPTLDQWRQVLTQTRDFLAQQSPFVARLRSLLADHALPRFRALLSEALGLLYDNNDSGFATLASWHNKTVWLVGCGLLLIIFLAAILQHGVLFLVGATGGLLSRMSRSLYRQDVPTDYGASWTTLFLSPVVGALMGWSGILLIILAVQLNVLGSVFNFDWCNPYAPVVLALAFLMGFSERWFDTILNQVEGKVVGASANNAAPTAGLKITSSASLPAATIGKPYSQTLSPSGPTFTWIRTAGMLPAGLSLDASGKVVGSATGPEGPATFTLQVSDATGKTASLQFTIVVGK